MEATTASAESSIVSSRATLPNACERPQPKSIQGRIDLTIALAAVVALLIHFALLFFGSKSIAVDLPLWIVLALGGGYQVFNLARDALRGEFASDLLAGISIVTAVILREYAAGTLVVLMLAGGQTLVDMALRKATSALRAMAARMPSIAHRKVGSDINDVALDEVNVGDEIVLFPHEVSPVDGIVIDGRGSMDESFVTGESVSLEKIVGSDVISGAVNGNSVLTIRAQRRPRDSRYAKILEVMHRAETERPRMRKLADTLGAYYTPLALIIAIAAWVISGETIRFLAVLVVATPCPLLIAIPVAIVGAISLCARRGIIIKDPQALEQISQCRTAMFDKTGTLTYGTPQLTEIVPISSIDQSEILSLAASVERYSKHPLAQAVIDSANERKIDLIDASEISEPPGQGLRATVDHRQVEITGRSNLRRRDPKLVEPLPPSTGGLECIVLIDDKIAAILKFRDEPRAEATEFVGHLRTQHQFDRVMIVSGDRKSEVDYLAGKIGVNEIYADQTPEQKLHLVRQITSKERTMYVGDGVNDAPALTTALVGISVNKGDVTAEAAGVVVPDGSLTKVDEFMHIGRRMRRIALESAVGGMALSVVGMILAAFGLIAPIFGALFQEVIDVIVIINALRVAITPPHIAHEFSTEETRNKK